MAKRALIAMWEIERTQRPARPLIHTEYSAMTAVGSLRTRLSGVMAFCSVMAFVATVLAPVRSALAWGEDGHQIVAFIAAAHLTPFARAKVGKILGANPTNADAVARAMAAASTRPDWKFRPRDPSTGPWHFVDLCLQDTKADIPRRCEGRCITAKIDEYQAGMRIGRYDKWGADGDLAFLIHLVADLHQPMHDVTNADKGGNCVQVSPYGENLHHAWDTTFVEDLEYKLHTRRGWDHAHRTAEALDTHFRLNPLHRNLAWETDATNDIAWESTLLARDKVYRELGLKTEPCLPNIRDCATEAPLEVKSEVAHFDKHYIAEAMTITEKQLYVAGMRLASLLNQLWPSH